MRDSADQGKHRTCLQHLITQVGTSGAKQVEMASSGALKCELGIREGLAAETRDAKAETLTEITVANAAAA